MEGRKDSGNNGRENIVNYGISTLGGKTLEIPQGARSISTDILTLTLAARSSAKRFADYSSLRNKENFEQSGQYVLLNADVILGYLEGTMDFNLLHDIVNLRIARELTIRNGQANLISPIEKALNQIDPLAIELKGVDTMVDEAFEGIN